MEDPMEVQFIGVENKGIIGKELIVFGIIRDCNLSNFMVSDIYFEPDGSISNAYRHTYHFPNIYAKKGDLIFLYTHDDIDRIEQASNHKYYILYWGLLNETIWSRGWDVAVITKIAERVEKKI